jgi:outer membrane protein assembly factor BamB
MHMNRFRVVAAVVCMIFVSSLVLIPFANAETGNSTLVPTLLWWYPTGNTVGSSPAVVNGVLYIGTYNGTVYALNATNGAQLWNCVPGGGGINSYASSPTVVNNVVYVSSDAAGGCVYALDAANGVQLWNYSTYTYTTSPTVVDGVVYVGTWNYGIIYALNASNGAQLWNSTALDWGMPQWIAPHAGVTSPPTVVNGVVYFGSEDGLTYALDASNGHKLWSVNSTDGFVYSSPTVEGGVVYVAVSEGNPGVGIVYAADAATGALIWNCTTASLGFQSPAVVDGVVYIGGDNGNVYALNAANGEEIWNYTLGNYVEYKSYVGEDKLSSPVVVAGVVYFGSMDFNVYALDAANGDLLWSYNAGGGIDSTPAVIRGVVYVGSEGGTVKALSVTPTSSSVVAFSGQLLIITLVASIIAVLSAVIISRKRRTKKIQCG